MQDSLTGISCCTCELPTEGGRRQEGEGFSACMHTDLDRCGVLAVSPALRIMALAAQLCYEPGKKIKRTIE